MSNKRCELCGKPARMFCESDQASLCWDCDEKVHAANFLVAKHCRTLLCHVCSSPTPWKAAGLKLGPTVSVCHTCAEDRVQRGRSRIENENDSQESESDDGEYYSDSDYYSEEEEEVEGENQVVPWSICSPAPPSPPPPTAVSPCSSEDDASFSSLKRMRENPFESENEDGCCSSQNLDSKLSSSDLSVQESENYDSSALSLFRPLKFRRTNNAIALLQPEQVAAGKNQVNSSAGTAAIIDTLRRFQQEIVSESRDGSELILGICKLTRDS